MFPGSSEFNDASTSISSRARGESTKAITTHSMLADELRKTTHMPMQMEWPPAIVAARKMLGLPEPGSYRPKT